MLGLAVVATATVAIGRGHGAAAASAPSPASLGWYGISDILDRSGTVTGLLLDVGSLDGRSVKAITLAPDGWATGPFDGRVLYPVPSSAGTALHAIDARTGVDNVVVTRPGALRQATYLGQTLLFLEADRTTGALDGLWRLAPSDVAPVRMTTGWREAGVGPGLWTFVPGSDSRTLAVEFCGFDRCAIRLLDIATGTFELLPTGDVGDVVGIAPDGQVIAYAACHGSMPCDVLSIDRRGKSRVLARDVAQVWMSPTDGALIVERAYTSPEYVLDLVDLASGARVEFSRASSADAVLHPSAPRAGWGADVPPGWLIVGPNGPPTAASGKMVRLAGGATLQIGATQ